MEGWMVFLRLGRGGIFFMIFLNVVIMSYYPFIENNFIICKAISETTKITITARIIIILLLMRRIILNQGQLKIWMSMRKMWRLRGWRRSINNLYKLWSSKIRSWLRKYRSRSWKGEELFPPKVHPKIINNLKVSGRSCPMRTSKLICTRRSSPVWRLRKFPSTTSKSSY